MVADRSGIPRAHKLASTLAHWHEQLRLYVLPARCGHHLNPMEGFWRMLKDRIGAGRCFPDLPQLYQRAPCAHGASRATQRCISLVAHSVSNLAGAAYMLASHNEDVIYRH